MDEHGMLYDLVKEIRNDIKELKETTDKNTVVLEEHQRRSLASEARLEVLERQAIRINWKTIGTFISIVGSIVGIVYTITRMI